MGLPGLKIGRSGYKEYQEYNATEKAESDKGFQEKNLDSYLIPVITMYIIHYKQSRSKNENVGFQTRCRYISSSHCTDHTCHYRIGSNSEYIDQSIWF